MAVAVVRADMAWPPSGVRRDVYEPEAHSRRALLNAGPDGRGAEPPPLPLILPPQECRADYKLCFCGRL